MYQKSSTLIVCYFHLFLFETCIANTIDSNKEKNVTLFSYSNHIDIFVEGSLSLCRRKPITDGNLTLGLNR